MMSNASNKVDVAIQSYKKPESLIYTLLTLKKHCGELIDTVYVQDDCSDDGTAECYSDPRFLELMDSIKIKVKVNSRPCWIHYFEKEMVKKPHNCFWYCMNKIVGRKPLLIEREDVRYQWALDSTDKDYLFVLHDDVMVTGNIIGKLLEAMGENVAIAGDLGQCWRCPYSDHCSPEAICSGERPSNKWPVTYCAATLSILNKYKFEKRACRINEWCCMLDVTTAKKLADQAIYFGSYEDLGDIGAYYFDEIVKRGYSFADPLAGTDERDSYYIHQWVGFTGHSVWVDQGKGKNEYPKDLIMKKIEDEFGYSVVRP